MVDEITGIIGALDWKRLLATTLKVTLIVAFGLGILRTARTQLLREELPDYMALPWMILGITILLLTDVREMMSGVHTLMIGMTIGIVLGRRSLHREIFDR